MSQLNDTNYPAATPVAADYVPFVRDSDSVIKTVTMLALANLLQSLSGQNSTVDVVSANLTLSTEQMVVADDGSAFDIDLPASSTNTGRSYHVYNKGAGAVTLVPNGSDTIAGGADLTLAQYASAIIRADGLGDWSAVVSA
jgi:hypothetical protein